MMSVSRDLTHFSRCASSTLLRIKDQPLCVNDTLQTYDHWSRCHKQQPTSEKCFSNPPASTVVVFLLVVEVDRKLIQRHRWLRLWMKLKFFECCCSFLPCFVLQRLINVAVNDHSPFAVFSHHTLETLNKCILRVTEFLRGWRFLQALKYIHGIYNQNSAQTIYKLFT